MGQYEEREKRVCFGTNQYSKKCGICTACRDRIECGNISKKKKTKKTRTFRDSKFYKDMQK